MSRFRNFLKIVGNTLKRCVAVNILLFTGFISLPAAAQDVGPAAKIISDTIFVAPPTGEREIDRASILAAFEKVKPVGIIQFAPGTYLVGKGISVTIIHKMAPGYFAFVPANTPYAFSSTGEGTSKWVHLFLPGKGIVEFWQEMYTIGETTSDNEEKNKKIIAAAEKYGIEFIGPSPFK